MIALRFNVRMAHLKIEKLRVLGLSGNAPAVIVEQAAEEAELAILVEHLHRHQVAELFHECLYLIVEQGEITLDL